MRLDRPAIGTDGVREIHAVHDIVNGKPIFANDTPGLAYPHLRRDIDDVGVLEPRRIVAQEFETCARPDACFEFTITELLDIGRVDRVAVRPFDLRGVGIPFCAMNDRIDDRALRGKCARPFASASAMRTGIQFGKLRMTARDPTPLMRNIVVVLVCSARFVRFLERRAGPSTRCRRRRNSR